MTDLKMLGLYNTGLNPENMIFPEKKGIRELSITEAEISDINLAEFPLLSIWCSATTLSRILTSQKLPH